MKSRDEILTRRLQRGDRGAQKELYDLHSAILMAIAVRYLGDRAQAEDLLHDTFIKIFASINKFKYRGEGSLKAWMSRIMVNAALERIKSRDKERFVSLDLVPLEAEEPPSVEQVPQGVLLEFITELPAGYRTVFNLFCIDGYSHRQIAEELGINEKSSSSQLLRAKRLLMTKIKKYIEVNG